MGAEEAAVIVAAFILASGTALGGAVLAAWSVRLLNRGSGASPAWPVTGITVGIAAIVTSVALVIAAVAASP